MAATHKSFLAWLYEEKDDDRRGSISSGRFSGHLETYGRTPRGFDPDAPSSRICDVPLADALRWARERAARIVVRVEGDASEGTHYTAGDTPIRWDGNELPTLPLDLELRRRRTPGWEFVDRTEADDPIEWEVSVDAMPRRLLAAEDEPIPVEGSVYLVLGEVNPERTLVRVRARTVNEACAAAGEDGAAQLGLDPAEWVVTGSEARPVGNDRFALDPAALG